MIPSRPAAMTVPYLPSLALYRAWMRLRLEGAGDAEAWDCLYAATPRSSRRRMARGTVAGAHGQPPLTLTVPVQGGGAVLKRGAVPEWRVSLHGRWPAVHLGALAAAYSATPYYAHLAPGLQRLIAGAGEGMSFVGLTASLHSLLTGIVAMETLLPDLREGLSGDAGVHLRRLAEEKSAGLDAETAFIDVIFMKGPEAVFTLLI